MSRSNLTDAIAAIDRCSDDELRQIQALISVRLGDNPFAGKTREGGGKKVDGGRAKSSKKGSGGTKKGNPQRKSQYATHPVYKAYRDARKAAEKKVTEEKVSFKELTGQVRQDYDEALAAWLQAKSGFRASNKEDEKTGSEPAQAQEDARHGSDTDVVPIGQPKADAIKPQSGPRPKKRSRASESGETPVSRGKYSDAPESWTPEDGEDWNSLSRQERRRIYHDAASRDSDMGE